MVEAVMEDQQLLRQYCEQRSQEAFGLLVDRHVGMVYGAAQRMVGDSHLAEDITQGAFTLLAQKGESVRRSEVVGGWLYNTTRNLAMHALRSEQRRRERERVAAEMQSLGAQSCANDIAAQLEPAMAELDDADRGALVLRFLEERNLKEVGAELGISEDAARMRVNRAVERLREIFARRGKAMTSAALAAALAALAAESTPAGLAAAIVVAGSQATLTTVTIMNCINAKSVAAIAVAALVAGATGYLTEKQKADRFEAQAADSLAELQRAKAESQTAQDSLAAREREVQRLQTAASDLAKARNEVAQLRQRETSPRTVAPPPAAATPRSSQTTAYAPGTYVQRGALAFAGYGSPEATIQTMAWAAVNGQTNVAHLVVPADLPQGEQLATNLMGALQSAGPAFAGMQIVAEKTLAEDRMEVLVKVDVQAPPGVSSNELPPPYNVLPMIRVASEWKLAGPPQDYSPDWGNSGQIKSFTQ
jgi:RNA polymerase sigma factor (sigma-70 family)